MDLVPKTQIIKLESYAPNNFQMHLVHTTNNININANIINNDSSNNVNNIIPNDNTKKDDNASQKNNNIVVINNFYNNNNSKENHTPINDFQIESKVNIDQVGPNKEKPRYDRRGNKIQKKGKQKVTFLDKISNERFVEYVDIESYKEFNGTDGNIINFQKKNVNGCCIVY